MPNADITVRRRYHRANLSAAPEFVPKLREIVGLHVKPAAHAIVLSVDEKSHIPALDVPSPDCRARRDVPARGTVLPRQ